MGDAIVWREFGEPVGEQPDEGGDAPRPKTIAGISHEVRDVHDPDAVFQQAIGNIDIVMACADMHDEAGPRFARNVQNSASRQAGIAEVFGVCRQKETRIGHSKPLL